MKKDRTVEEYKIIKEIYNKNILYNYNYKILINNIIMIIEYSSSIFEFS